MAHVRRSAYKSSDYVTTVACNQSNVPRVPLPNYNAGRYRMTDVHKLIIFN
jgi:hypothetical protein